MIHHSQKYTTHERIPTFRKQTTHRHTLTEIKQYSQMQTHTHTHPQIKRHSQTYIIHTHTQIEQSSQIHTQRSHINQHLQTHTHAHNQTFIDHLSNNCQTFIALLSNIYRASINHLSKRVCAFVRSSSTGRGEMDDRHHSWFPVLLKWWKWTNSNPIFPTWRVCARLCAYECACAYVLPEGVSASVKTRPHTVAPQTLPYSPL